jgi:ACR3 family arsenite efflux pump ArsB
MELLAVRKKVFNETDRANDCAAVFHELSILDRLLTPLILVCMIMGVAIGACVDGVQEAFDTVRLREVSVREYHPWSQLRMILISFKPLLSACSS